MYPLSLTLRGFRGIRDGLGRDVLKIDLENLAAGAELVALSGANGRGKTTILDNLQPYLTMPSRAAQGGTGAFSFYDHVVLPESSKELVWMHEGRRYRSEVIIRDNGRRSTEAYLFVAGADGAWRPAMLIDGTVSDGKVGTYVRCVEQVLGSAETFFTSVFSAQGKRQLSSYQNSEIKSLLADLLGLDRIRHEGKRAAQVVELLKVGLASMRQHQLSVEGRITALQEDRARFGDPVAAVANVNCLRDLAQQRQAEALARVARLRVVADQALQGEARRQQLLVERVELATEHGQFMEKLATQREVQVQRINRLERKISERMHVRAAQDQVLIRQRAECERVLQDVASVRSACRRVALARSSLQAHGERLQSAELRRRGFDRLVASMEASAQQLDAIEREAGQAALRVEDLSRQFILTREVPCAGTAMQRQCKLLCDARSAGDLVPSAQELLRRLAADRTRIQATLVAQGKERDILADASKLFERAQWRVVRARERLQRYERLAARIGEMQQALARREEIDQQTKAQAKFDSHDCESPDELSERRDINIAVMAIDAQQDQQLRQLDQAQRRLDTALASLPPAYDQHVLLEAERLLEERSASLVEADRAYISAVHCAEQSLALEAQCRLAQAELGRSETRVARLGAQITSWSLLTKCLGNDGLIALAIDDLGPTLTGLANDLLLTCYGQRFTVSLQTQLENRKGEQREGFVIEVHDGETGHSKRVEQMSGGERVWINESLVRAVALYLAQNSGRCYGALFSDEVDGSLDPDRKRMFMAMKREVLRLGGYKREIFISQTPALTDMADVVIDLDALSITGDGRPDEPGLVGGSKGVTS